MQAPAQETPPRPRAASWRGLAGWSLAALFFFYVWVLRVSPSVMVEQLMRDFAVSGVILGNLSALYFYTYASLQVPVGIIIDRWGPRRVLTLMALLCGLGTLLFAQAPTVELAYLGRALIGTGGAFAFVGTMVLASYWFPTQRFALLSGSAMSLGILGGVMGQAPLAILVEGQGWRSSVTILAGGAFAIAVLTWLIVRDRPPDQTPSAEPSHLSIRQILAGLWLVARRRQTWAICAYGLFMSAPLLAFAGLWGVPYAMTAYDVERPTAAFAVSSVMFGWGVGGPLWGWISGRIGRRKPPIVMAGVLATGALAGALYLPDLSLDGFRLLLFLQGIGGAGMTLSYALIREHSGRSVTGAALGLVNMAPVAGGAIFQPVVGLLLDAGWDGTLLEGARVYDLATYEQAFLILPAMTFLALLSALAIGETHCRFLESQPAAA